MKLGKQIIDQYAPALSADWALGDSNLVYGMAVAWTFVYALQNAGTTRRARASWPRSAA